MDEEEEQEERSKISGNSEKGVPSVATAIEKYVTFFQNS